MVKYTHLKLRQDIAAPAGYYTPEKESIIEIDGRKVLYILSSVEVDSSCCGKTSFNTALVPGYIIEQHVTESEDGSPVSEVEPITDRTAREKVKEVIRATENVSQVEFW